MRTLIYRSLLIALCAVFLFGSMPAYALDFSRDAAGHPLNSELSKTMGWLIYGTPQAVPGNQFDQNQWRYYGFDIMGNPFTNPIFRNDADSGREPWQKNWIKEPWVYNTPNVLCKESPYLEDPNLPLWLDGIYPAWPGWDGDKLSEYLHILTPPTEYGPGVARGWHKDSSGKVWYESFFLAPINPPPVFLADLAVENLQVNGGEQIEPGQLYEGKCDIRNFTGMDLIVSPEGVDKRIPIQLYFNDEMVHETTIAIPKDGTEFNFSFKIPEDFNADRFTVTIKLNMRIPRILEEKTADVEFDVYANNEASVTLGLVPDQTLDLEVTKVLPGQFFTGQAGDVTVYIRNNSTEVPVENPSVPVRLVINGETLATRNITLGPGVKTQVLFKVTPPDSATGFNVTGEINHTRVYTETNYLNNKKTVAVQIAAPAAPPNCTNPTVTWTEYRSAADYKSGDIVKSHYTYISHRSCSGSGPTRECSNWTEERLNGYTVKFTTTLHATMAASPTKIKSGYGVETTVKTWITTNYDKPTNLSNAQNVWAYFPDGTGASRLQAAQGDPSSNAGTVTWRLPPNMQSPLKARKHYIPVSWPDGNYQIRIIATDVAGPGDPCKALTTNVTVNGNMYEDDFTN